MASRPSARAPAASSCRITPACWWGREAGGAGRQTGQGREQRNEQDPEHVLHTHACVTNLGSGCVGTANTYAWALLACGFCTRTATLVPRPFLSSLATHTREKSPIQPAHQALTSMPTALLTGRSRCAPITTRCSSGSRASRPRSRRCSGRKAERKALAGAGQRVGGAQACLSVQTAMLWGWHRFPARHVDAWASPSCSGAGLTPKR